MIADEEGFKYPSIDIGECIDCGMCEKVCPTLACEETMHLKQSGFEIRAFGGWHHDEDIRYDSSSGGAFTLFAEQIINEGGIVFGCAFDPDMKAVHIGVEKTEDLKYLRGSKYVQSDTGEIYERIKKELSLGRNVMFVGTPCQAAGLYSYVGDRLYDKLYIIDFICHGVPSPYVFREYIKSLENKRGSKLASFRFRNKDHGWTQSGLQLGTLATFANGEKVRRFPAFFDPYMNAFLEDICLRPSCYECKFKKQPKKYADITLADYWGVGKMEPDLYDKKGTSLIIANTPDGVKLWDKVKGRFYYKEVDTTKATMRNRPLLESARMNPQRAMFFKKLGEEGFEYVRRRYMSGIIWVWYRTEQLIKFAIVGCSNTVISLLVYYVMHTFFGIHYMIAYTGGFIISVCNAFFWNNRYVFREKEENSLIRAFIKLVSSYGLSFLLSVLLISVMVEFIGIPSVIAPILKLFVTIPFNYILNKVWVFKDKGK